MSYYRDLREFEYEYDEEDDDLEEGGDGDDDEGDDEGDDDEGGDDWEPGTGDVGDWDYGDGGGGGGGDDEGDGRDDFSYDFEDSDLDGDEDNDGDAFMEREERRRDQERQAQEFERQRQEEERRQLAEAYRQQQEQLEEQERQQQEMLDEQERQRLASQQAPEDEFAANALAYTLPGEDVQQVPEAEVPIPGELQPDIEWDTDDPTAWVAVQDKRSRTNRWIPVDQFDPERHQQVDERHPALGPPPGQIAHLRRIGNREYSRSDRPLDTGAVASTLDTGIGAAGQAAAETGSALIGNILRQNPATGPVFSPPSPFSPGDRRVPDEQAAADAAASAAAEATAATGAGPQQVANAAATAAVRAIDKQTFAQQTPWTKMAFQARYGANAANEWAREHNAELARNERIYGSREPAPGTPALEEGIGRMPDRRIGVTPPPRPGMTARYGVNQSVPSISTASTAPTLSPRVPGTATAPGTAAPVINPGNAAPSTLTPPAVQSPALPRDVSPSPNNIISTQPGTPDPANVPGIYAPSTLAPRLPGQSSGGEPPRTGIPTPRPPASVSVAPGDGGVAPAVPGERPYDPDEGPRELPAYTYPADPDQGPREALPGSTGAQNATGERPDDWIDVHVTNQPQTRHTFTRSEWDAMDPVGKAQWTVDNARGADWTPPSQAERPDDRIDLTWANDPRVKHTTTRAQWNATPPDTQAKWTVINARPLSSQRVSEAPAGAGTTRPMVAAYSYEAPETVQMRADPAVPPPPGPPPHSALRPVGPGGDPVAAAVSSTTPLDSLAALSLQQRGIDPEEGNYRSDAYNIAQGISALLSGRMGPDGKPEGAWAEPYLNDVARFAWTRQEMQQGRNADPRDAPIEYVEKWKDAFYGSDTKVPLVKELDQQMIDYAATRTPAGRPFRWQEAFGATGENGLISAQVTGVDCGPNAFSTILRSRGYNVAPKDAFAYVRTFGNTYHNGNEFQGPDQYAHLLRTQAGLQTEVVRGMGSQTWARIDQELAEGRPVTLSGPSHYWVIASKDAQGRYYAGATATSGNPHWLKPGEMRYAGSGPDTVIFARGDVNPNSHAVTKMGLKPPTMGPRDTRALLSTQTRYGGEQPRPMSNAPATSQPSQAPAVTGPPSAQASKPTYTEPEVRTMQQRIMQEMPKFNLPPPGQSTHEDRMRAVQPALEWFEREYGYPAEVTAGLMFAENGVGHANSPAVRGNNLFSLAYNPNLDKIAYGYAPGQGAEQRWAGYKSIEDAFARKMGIFSHPENRNYNQLWQNRQKGADAAIDNMVKGGYIINEPGPGNSIAEWRTRLKQGIELYRTSTGGRRAEAENGDMNVMLRSMSERPDRSSDPRVAMMQTTEDSEPPLPRLGPVERNIVQYPEVEQSLENRYERVVEPFTGEAYTMPLHPIQTTGREAPPWETGLPEGWTYQQDANGHWWPVRSRAGGRSGAVRGTR